MPTSQHHITRICVNTAQLLLEHGTESALVFQLTLRLGRALGMDDVACSFTPNAVTVTTILNGHCLTTVRNNGEKGINMQVVTHIQRLVILAERGLYDWQTVENKLQKIIPFTYHRYIVVLMVGLSCASFSHLAGGDKMIACITFLASAMGMLTRQILAKHHFNPIIIFAMTAFICSLVSGLALKYQLGNDPQIALASSVLLLVPGYPLINALADILKGYISMGIARWAKATVLTFGACMGIIFALSLLHITRWG